MFSDEVLYIFGSVLEDYGKLWKKNFDRINLAPNFLRTVSRNINARQKLFHGI